MDDNFVRDFVNMMDLESDFENMGSRKIPINKYASRL